MRNLRAFMRLVFVMCALFLFFAPAAEAEGEFHNWRYREGDSPRTAFGDFTWLQSLDEDDENWKPYDGTTPPVSEGMNYVWLRMRLDPTSPDVNTLFFVTMNQSFRVWQDDKLIYQYGTLAHQQIGYGWRWHLVTLPADQRKTAHVITFQMYSETSASLGRLMGMSIGTNADQVKRLFLFDLPYFINLPVVLMLMVIVGVYYMNQSDLRRLYRYVFVFLIIFAVWMFSASNGTIFLWDAPGIWWRVLLGMLYAMPVAAVVLEVAKNFGIEIPLPRAVENQNGLMVMTPVLFAFMTILQSVQAYCLWRSEGASARHCRAFLLPTVVMTLIAILSGLFRIMRLSQFVPYMMVISSFPWSASSSARSGISLPSRGRWRWRWPAPSSNRSWIR